MPRPDAKCFACHFTACHVGPCQVGTSNTPMGQMRNLRRRDADNLSKVTS